jgi:hypothetical protein
MIEDADFQENLEPMEVKVLGKIIGKASGWDQGDTAAFNFMDFVPNELGKKFLTNLPNRDIGCLVVDFENGTVEYYEKQEPRAMEDIVDPAELDKYSQTFPLTVDWGVLNNE